MQHSPEREWGVHIRDTTEGTSEEDTKAEEDPLEEETIVFRGHHHEMTGPDHLVHLEEGTGECHRTQVRHHHQDHHHPTPLQDVLHPRCHK